MSDSYLRHYAGARVLVTGGAGAIGGNLSRALLDAGAAEVTILDDLSSAARWTVPQDPRVVLLVASVLDERDLKRAFAGRPATVFHLAALFANQNSIDHPEDDLMVNGLGTLKVLQYAHLTGVERMVYASSGCSVYGKSPLPLREEFLSIDLATPYQITKMLGELYANFYRNFYGVQTVRTRFFNSFGPGEIPGRYRNVIPNFIYWAMRGEPLPITGTGEETRDWTFVGDIVDGLLRAGAMKEALGEAFNLASGLETRVIDVASWINEATGNKAGVRYIERRKWDDKDRLLASIDKARSVLGYEARTDLKAGLGQTVEWFRANWRDIQETARF
ncbi:MAG: NAD-dependent epimerase/dehydratase family protein [Candidatus Rokubacteria bacterium]|nr:NAD-dependent epimerase/dehydratase family protein [Candidatus Rokubacteria bacterium]